jgi:hypothetical protein
MHEAVTGQRTAFATFGCSPSQNISLTAEHAALLISFRMTFPVTGRRIATRQIAT